MEQERINTQLDHILNEISWAELKKLINSSIKIREAVTSGSFRILQKNRQRIQSAVRKKCYDNEKILCSIFVSWFNEQKEYYDCLVPFFGSEDHEALLKKQERGSSEYIISDEYFEKFINLIKPSDVDKFLLLSPIYFTRAQKKQLEYIRGNQNEPRGSAQSSSETAVKDKYQSDGIFFTKGQWKHHRKTLEKCQNEIRKLQKKNASLCTQKKGYDKVKANLTKQIDELKSTYDKEVKNLEGRKDLLQAKIAELETEIDRMTNRFTEKDSRIRNLEKEAEILKNEKETFFHQILSRLDLEDFISDLNAPNDVLDLLSTIIRPPETDDAINPKETPMTLATLWETLMLKEKAIVHDILKISAEEVADGRYFQNWDYHEDDFNDLKYSLSARIYLTSIFHNILHNYYIKK